MKHLLLIFVIVLTAMMRLIPHPPNFTPIIAICLFSGAYFKNRIFAILVPVGAMFLSDLFLGVHDILFWVYGSILLIVILGMFLNNSISLKRYLFGGLGGSVIFFILTNFGVWLSSGFYPKNMFGIYQCYLMALPFFINTLFGSLFYICIVFGLYSLIHASYSKYIFKSNN